ncbi:hypothetical protein BT69DRAFT_1333638 [Atractiella rhizophila]|nr:hypothetical protein BT69DRAFT_1333638 [Atractiella rhizophila]
MPPKKQQQAGPSKPKEDKTFGLKNKNKSSKVQQYVKTVQQQESQRGKNKETLAKEKEKADREKAKAAEAKRKDELNELFKPVQMQKVPFGVDPKSVLCAYFKAGTCEKGNKCKFSHDLNVDRKSEKKDIYTDARQTDTMDTWDEAKLSEVVLSKHGNPKTTTDIVCKFFIDAIEAGTYGWFWECPNGGVNCKYRHALPPGFVLKSQKKKQEEEEAKKAITMEEFLERKKLPANLTPVTPESFATWKKTRLDKKEAEEETKRKAKETQIQAGKGTGMSGRDLFTYNPLLMEDEDEEPAGDDWDFKKYREETEKEREEAEKERLRKLGIEEDYNAMTVVDETQDRDKGKGRAIEADEENVGG